MRSLLVLEATTWQLFLCNSHHKVTTSINHLPLLACQALCQPWMGLLVKHLLADSLQSSIKPASETEQEDGPSSKRKLQSEEPDGKGVR